jgi:hypothetical protein
MTIDPTDISIQQITKKDLEVLMTWAAQEGWNPGKHDLDVFWNTDPDGFYGCFVQDEMIAGGAIISYAGEFGFMGLFIVQSPYRNQGIGNALWHARKNRLISRLQPHASIGMDGVLAMQGYYHKGGFNIAFRDERFEFVGKAHPYANEVTAIVNDDLADILELDTRCFGVQRKRFLEQWLIMPESKAMKYKQHNKVKGYAVIRKAERGYKIGPLFAQDETIAEELLKSCLSHAVDDVVFLDIPTINARAIDLVHKYEGTYVFECARMYHGEAPKVPMDQIFGITSFELG